MAKAFIILTSNATANDQRTIGQLFRGRGWWHHTPQGWVLLDRSGETTPAEIRDTIRAHCPRVHFYVIEVPAGAPYAGFGPWPWHRWFRETWKRFRQTED